MVKDKDFSLRELNNQPCIIPKCDYCGSRGHFHKEGCSEITEFDPNNLVKISKILNKYDSKLPFGCIVELSKLIH